MRKTFTVDKRKVIGQLYYVRESSPGSPELNNIWSYLCFTDLFPCASKSDYTSSWTCVNNLCIRSVRLQSSSSQTMSGVAPDRSLVRRLHALRNRLTFELSGGVSPTLFRVLWDSFNGATASTCIWCNRTNAGIQLSCVHVNTLGWQKLGFVVWLFEVFLIYLKLKRVIHLDNNTWLKSDSLLLGTQQKL